MDVAADSGDEAAPADEMDEEQRVRWRGKGNGRWLQKWCRECQLWRPKHCGHCEFCGHCTLRLDHHCIFIGTCIGERNVRFFALFLLSCGAGILCLCFVGVRRLAQLGCFGAAPLDLLGIEPAPPTCNDGLHRYIEFIGVHAFGYEGFPTPSATSAASAASGFSKCFAAGSEVVFLVGSIFVFPQIFLGGLLWMGGVVYTVCALADIDRLELAKKVKAYRGMTTGDATLGEDPDDFTLKFGAFRFALQFARRVLGCRGVVPLCCARMECRRDCRQDLQRACGCAAGEHDSGQMRHTPRLEKDRDEGEELQPLKNTVSHPQRPEPTNLGAPSHAQDMPVHRRGGV